MYKVILSSKQDDVFSSICGKPFDQQTSILLGNNFISMQKGGFSKGIYHDNTVLIKIFESKRYGKSVYFKEYFDYVLIGLLNSYKTPYAPLLYGYAPKNFMVVQFLGPQTLTQLGLLSLSQGIQLVDQVFSLLRSSWQVSRLLVNDLYPQNIILYNNNFYVIDYSCVILVAPQELAQYTIKQKIISLLNALYENNNVSLENCLLAKSHLNQLYL